MTLDRDTLLNDRYRIVEILGQGGMAAVYRAIDENLGVEVAVKENLFTTEEYARQFRREAVILASLRHPNLPRVTDHFVIEQQGQYLVMDYIEGEDLRQRMDRIGQLPEQEVIIIGVAICDALSYMHTRTQPVLHRDIKPGNVKITPEGEIYLVDFGLAKLVEGREITTTGARAMTPGFSPPEQYGTARTDHRSDIYSLGATLYAALTDSIPEDGLGRAMGQTELTMIAHYNPKVSKRLSTSIEKALEIKPSNRYQRAGDFMQDLLNARSNSRRNLPMELVLSPPPDDVGYASKFIQDERNSPEYEIEEINEIESQSIPVSRPLTREAPRVITPPKKRNRSSLLLIIIFLLVVIAVSTTILTRPEGFRPIFPFIYSPSQTPTILITDVDANETAASDVPAEATGSARVTNRAATEAMGSSLTTTETPTPTRTRRPTLTPSPTPTALGGGNGQIIFSSDRINGVPDLWVINSDGSNLRQLTDIAEGACQPDWSPDGQKIVFTSPCLKNQENYSGSGLFIINANGSDLTPLPSVPGGDYDPDWSPDGSKIAFTTLREGGTPKIYIMDLENNSTVPLITDSTMSEFQPSWAPYKDLIAFVGGDNRIWAVSTSGGDRFNLSIGGGQFRSSNPVWSPDGSWIIFTQRDQDDESGATWLMAMQYSEEGNNPRRVDGSELTAEASYSPDGYLFVARTWTTGNHDIAIYRSSGIFVENLTQDPAYDFDPDWYPAVFTP